MLTPRQARNDSLCYQVLAPEQLDLGPADRFLGFWSDCRGDAFAPRWGTDFRLWDLPSDILPNVSVVDVIGGGQRYYYRFWGTNNVVTKGFEMSQKYLDQSPVESVRTNGRHQFGMMVEEGRPLVFLYDTVYRHEVQVSCFTLRVPLSSDGRTVDRIASYQDLSRRRNAWEDMFDAFRKQPASAAP